MSKLYPTGKPSNALESQKLEAAAKSDKRNRGELERVHTEKIDNGYMVSAHYAPKSSGKNAVYPEPSRNFFASHKEAAAHHSKVLAEDAAQES